MRRVVLVASASFGSWRSALSSWLMEIAGHAFLDLRHPARYLGLSEISIRLLTALNLLPSTMTVPPESNLICRQSATKRTQTWRSAVLLQETKLRAVCAFHETTQPILPQLVEKIIPELAGSTQPGSSLDGRTSPRSIAPMRLARPRS